MQSSLKPLVEAIYATTGPFIDKLREDARTMEQMADYFYRVHRQEYQYARAEVYHKQKAKY